MDEIKIMNRIVGLILLIIGNITLFKLNIEIWWCILLILTGLIILIVNQDKNEKL